MIWLISHVNTSCTTLVFDMDFEFALFHQVSYRFFDMHGERGHNFGKETVVGPSFGRYRCDLVKFKGSPASPFGRSKGRKVLRQGERCHFDTLSLGRFNLCNFQSQLVVSLELMLILDRGDPRIGNQHLN